jgi:hypothetical protein
LLCGGEGYGKLGSSSLPAIKASAGLKQSIQHNSNVTQLPDGQVQVSDKSGALSITQINVKLQGADKSKKQQPSLQVSAGQNRYFDKVFSARNAQNVGFSYQHPLSLSKSSPWASLALKAGQRWDFLYAFGPKNTAFHTSTVGVLGIRQPKKLKAKHMDLWVPVFGLDLEYRNFLGAYEPSVTGQSKDTWTPSLLLMGLGMKKYKSVNTKATLMLNVRQALSDVDNEQALNWRLGTMWSADWKHWGVSPSLAWSARRQDSYNNQSRRDDRLDVGIGVAYRWSNNKFKASLSLMHTEQWSNQSRFSYDNDQASLGLDLQF